MNTNRQPNQNRLNFSNNNSNNNNNKPKFNLTWVYIGLIGLIFILMMTSHGKGNTGIAYSKFQELVDSGYVTKIHIDKSEQELLIEASSDAKDYIDTKAEPNNKGVYVLTTKCPTVEKLDEYLVEKKFKGSVEYENGGAGFWEIVLNILPFAILIAFFVFMVRKMNGAGSGGGIFSIGKSKAKLFEGGKNGEDKITFKDVAGLSGAKQEVQEVVDFLRNPQKYTELGGKIPKGILLVGPPGTGKTLLAKAVAGEANVSFFSLSGSDFVEMFVGVGASRVRDLFVQAKAKAPSIVFIDEIDAIGRARGNKASFQANDERESTLNQLLTEMDGFGANTGVIVMAATNRVDILDKALLRAGRFDRQITVDLPDLTERQQIFNVHLKPVKIDETVDVEMLARQTPGLSGADIANVCNEAALIAARRKLDWVNKQCFLDAIDRVLGGLEKKTKVLTENEKRTIAIHEAGHATISWFLQYANPLVKVTIVPRGQALGANWYMPEERPVTTKEEMFDQLCGLLGGRAAEELFTGHICTGASNDLERVTKMAYAMIAVYGMGERLPNVNFYNFSEDMFNKPYSDQTAQLIDDEVKDIIEQQYERAKNVLLQHSKGLQELAQLLIDKEVIYPADLERIFGPRPWRSRSDEIMELNAQVAPEVTEENSTTDFNDENAAIIRQKAVDAIIEKQRRLDEQRQREEQERKERELAEQRRREEEERRIEEERRNREEQERRRLEEERRKEEAELRRQEEEQRKKEEERRREEQQKDDQAKRDDNKKNGQQPSLFDEEIDPSLFDDENDQPETKNNNDYNPFLDSWGGVTTTNSVFGSSEEPKTEPEPVEEEPTKADGTPDVDAALIVDTAPDVDAALIADTAPSVENISDTDADVIADTASAMEDQLEDVEVLEVEDEPEENPENPENSDQPENIANQEPEETEPEEEEIIITRSKRRKNDDLIEVMPESEENGLVFSFDDDEEEQNNN